MQLAGLTAVLQATGELLQQCCMLCQDGSSCAARAYSPMLHDLPCTCGCCLHHVL
jgi:hypothetical protein